MRQLLDVELRRPSQVLLAREDIDISESMIMVSPSMTDRGRIGLCMRKT
jgi:hypothetical protein